MPSYGRAWRGRELSGGSLSGRILRGSDPLDLFGDSFDGARSLEQRGWTIYGAGDLGAQAIANGEVHFTATSGGSGRSWWYSQIGGPLNEDGILVYKLITGDFDVRARMRVRNAANTGSPSAAVGEWRFAGIQVQDPAGLAAGTAFNYVHLGLGSDPTGGGRQNAIEWKVTDSGGATGPQSTFASDAGSAPLDYDLRIIRNGQTFQLSYRRVDVGQDLRSNVGWTDSSGSPIIKNANTPARVGGATPVAFPDTLAVGIMPPYAGPQVTIDLQCWCEEIVARSV